MIKRLITRLLLAPAERQVLDAFARMDMPSQRDLLSISDQFARQFPTRRPAAARALTGGAS